jgi:prepilin-type N-terminal cleavage/methylation domain-containing protein
MRTRSGMTLIEIMVVIAIIAVVTAIALPSMNAVFDLEQRGAARDLAMTYKFLLNEASMRNVTFRIAYNLDDNTYQVEVGDANTLIFSSPEKLEAYQQEQEKKMHLLDKAGAEEAAAATENRFAGLTMEGFESKVELPGNSAWGFMYTPQYGEPQIPVPVDDRKEDAPPNIVYSYVFGNGEAEYTVVRIVSRDDPEDGYSIEVEPVSGVVRVDSDLIDIGKALSWLPTEGPSFQ